MGVGGKSRGPGATPGLVHFHQPHIFGQRVPIVLIATAASLIRPHAVPASGHRWFQSREPNRQRAHLPPKISSWLLVGVWGVTMNFSNAKDDSLLVFYESVRRQVEADMNSGGRYRFVGESARQYAERLREEMDRRRLKFTPIDWDR